MRSHGREIPRLPNFHLGQEDAVYARNASPLLEKTASDVPEEDVQVVVTAIKWSLIVLFDSKLNIPRQIYYRNEDQLFEQFPQLFNEWLKYKAIAVLRESKRRRFGKSKNDFAHFLQYKWMADKKYEFVMRLTGLREEPFWRRYMRSKSLYY